MKNRKLYYDIYGEFYNVNKYRELKSVPHHGSNRLNHINRVSKMSFRLSKLLRLDYVSCTRGALLHDFFTTDDLSRNDTKYKNYLQDHPRIALDNSRKYFKLNNIEEDIILTHMFPIVKGKPKYAESRVVCLCDKLVSLYEYVTSKTYLAMNFLLFLMIR